MASTEGQVISLNKRKGVDKSTTTVCDALQLARGWRAVAAVSGKDDDRPALDHTVYIEQYDVGLRLVATDSVRLLVAWVPANGHSIEDEPDAGELPHATAVAVDQWGRAKSLLAHMGQLAAKEEYVGLSALVRLGVPWQAPDVPEAELQFDGFQALAVNLEYPDNERLQLPVYEGSYPEYRNLLTAWTSEKTQALAMNQDSLAILAKAVAPFGAECGVEFRFSGELRPIAVTFGLGPTVRGLVMPMKWDFDKDAPEEPDDDA